MIFSNTNTNHIIFTEYMYKIEKNEFNIIFKLICQLNEP